MNPFKIEKILVPIDFSETSMLAFEHAIFAAKLLKAELVLLHVIENHWEKFNIVVPELRVNAPNDIVDAIDARLEEIASNILSTHGIKSTCITSSGVIFSEIITEAKEQNVDLIIMGTHGNSGFSESFIGSNTFKVTTSSACPVISVQTHSQKTGFNEILLPIDDSSHSLQKVNHAVILAKHFSSRIQLVGLSDFEDELNIQKFEIKLLEIEAYIKKSGLVSARKIIAGKNKATMVADYAKIIGADLIIIMTDQDENISGQFMGAYAQQIVNNSKIPVFSIRAAEGSIFTLEDFPSIENQ